MALQKFLRRTDNIFKLVGNGDCFDYQMLELVGGQVRSSSSLSREEDPEDFIPQIDAGPGSDPLYFLWQAGNDIIPITHDVGHWHPNCPTEEGLHSAQLSSVQQWRAQILSLRDRLCKDMNEKDHAYFRVCIQVYFCKWPLLIG